MAFFFLLPHGKSGYFKKKVRGETFLAPKAARLTGVTGSKISLSIVTLPCLEVGDALPCLGTGGLAVERWKLFGWRFGDAPKNRGNP